MPGSGINGKLFKERIGQIKIFSIILGLIALILCIDHYNSKPEEVGFFWSIVVCFTISLILAVLSVLGLMDHPNMVRLDDCYHIAASILLIVISCFFIVSVDKGADSKSSYYNRRAAAGGLGLFYGIFCGYIGGFLF